MGGRPRLGNVQLFSDRAKPKARANRNDCSPCQIASLRLRDLAKLFRARYGVVLPDDDAGRDDIDVAVNHLASLAHPKGRIGKWLGLWAPWLTLAARDQLIAKAVIHQQHWSADQLAWRLRLTMEDRMALGITTIGAIDMPKRERTKRRRAKAAQRTARNRKPRMTRAEYEATALTTTQPWVAEGISRRTWYRRRAQEQAGTGQYAP